MCTATYAHYNLLIDNERAVNKREAEEVGVLARFIVIKQIIHLVHMIDGGKLLRRQFLTERASKRQISQWGKQVRYIFIDGEISSNHRRGVDLEEEKERKRKRKIIAESRSMRRL